MRPSRRDLLQALPFPLLAASSASIPTLRQLWLRAPSDNFSMPRTRWPLPPPAAIPAQLESLRAIGIGGVELIPASPDFLDAARLAVSEATRLDMKVSFPVLLEPSTAHTLTVTALDLPGPFQYEGPIPFSATPGPVLAVTGARIRNDTLTDLIDLTDDFTGGAGRWRVEAGQWRLFAFRLSPAPFVQPAARDILLAFGPMLGRTIDSLVIPPPPSTLLWSAGTLAAFRRLHHYDLTPLLPALFFDIGPRTSAIRADAKALQNALLEERYHQPIREACRRILVHPRTESPTLDGDTLEAIQRNAAALFHQGVTRFYHPQPPTLPNYHALAAALARTAALLREGSPAGEEAPAIDGLRISSRTLDNGVDLFYVSNPGSVKTAFSHALPGKQPELWDPFTAAITRAAPLIIIEPASSVFVVYHPQRRSRWFRRRVSME